MRVYVSEYGLSLDGLLYEIEWKSPELLQGMDASKESDVYAFGMIILELCTRKYLYPGWTTLKIGMHVIKNHSIDFQHVQGIKGK